jgi:hypothetical protein
LWALERRERNAGKIRTLGPKGKDMTYLIFVGLAIGLALGSTFAVLVGL